MSSRGEVLQKIAMLKSYSSPVYLKRDKRDSKYSYRYENTGLGEGSIPMEYATLPTYMRGGGGREGTPTHKFLGKRTNVMKNSGIFGQISCKIRECCYF